MGGFNLGLRRVCARGLLGLVAGLSMLAAPAGAMEVHFGPSLSTDQVAPVEGWFIGYDLNHDGHLRSADHEIARAYSTVGERVWNDMEHGWWTWDDVFMVGFTPDLPQPTIDFRYERNAATGALQGWLLEFKTFRWCDYFCRDMTFDYGPDGTGQYVARLSQRYCNRYTMECDGSTAVASGYGPLYGAPAQWPVTAMGNVVPEPSSLAMLAAGLVLLGGTAAWRRRASARYLRV